MAKRNIASLSVHRNTVERRAKRERSNELTAAVR